MPLDDDGEQSGPLRRSSSRRANTASSASQHAILTAVEPRLWAISNVTRAHIASIELAFAADLPVIRFFALPFILTPIIPEPRIFTKIFAAPSLSAMARPLWQRRGSADSYAGGG
jgi:hypothetical protein